MDDLEFVRNCLKGDKRSWDEFVEKYSRLIYTYIYDVLDAKGYSTFVQNYSQDIFQGIFSSLIKDDFRKLRSFQARNGCSLASWLRQVAVNSTISYLRRVKPAVSLDAENEEGLALKDILLDGSLPAADTLDLKERLEHLKECIEDLGRQDRYFLELHINRGLRLEELKGVLRLSRGAVDMQKSRIIRQLKECFKNKGAWLDF